MCPQGPLPVNGMNGDIITRVDKDGLLKDGPFLDKPKGAKKAAAGKEESPKAVKPS